jgi:hypothetical protein
VHVERFFNHHIREVMLEELLVLCNQFIHISELEIMLCCICAFVAWTIEMMFQFKFKLNSYSALFNLHRGKKNC